MQVLSKSCIRWWQCSLNRCIVVIPVRKRLFRLTDANIQSHKKTAHHFNLDRSFVEHEAEMSEDDGHTDDEDDDEMDEELVSRAHSSSHGMDLDCKKIDNALAVCSGTKFIV